MRYKTFNNIPPKPADEIIESMRANARELQKVRQAVVQEIWRINLALARRPDSIEQAKLKQRKADLVATLERENYDGRLGKLLSDIHNKEVALYGTSDVGGSAPYNL
jgi:hypothetical protein